MVIFQAVDFHVAFLPSFLFQVWYSSFRIKLSYLLLALVQLLLMIRHETWKRDEIRSKTFVWTFNLASFHLDWLIRCSSIVYQGFKCAKQTHIVGKRQIKTVRNIADCTARRYFFKRSVVKLIPPFLTLLGTSFIACSISKDHFGFDNYQKFRYRIQFCYSLITVCAMEV